MLACETADGQRLYPAWQFTSDGRTIPGLPAVLDVLLAVTEPWTAAIWLTTPADRLGGRSATDVLRSVTMTYADLQRPGEIPQPLAGFDMVLAAAREDAARWAM